MTCGDLMIVRVQITVRGIVQGVGFRPFIFSLAEKQSLKGRVLNSPAGVVVEVEGDRSSIRQLLAEIKLNPPPLALIESVQMSDDLAPVYYSDFRIAESALDGEHFAPVSPDIATCHDCLIELFDPANRRYRYPFINCTNCGPRFTIIREVPYDRDRTTMREFEMCGPCREEYVNPLNRRFHAEPTACQSCGPSLLLIDASGDSVMPERSSANDIVVLARDLLLSGQILSIKGIGGFHLACDALNRDSVERLRARKYREEKPFALMADSLEMVRDYCFVSEAEEALLVSERRPIVLLRKKPDSVIPEAVAPGIKTLGFMLPYTPLHYLIIENFQRPLILTSGNVSDEPICYENEDATTRLRGIADYFLLHDRQIHMRTDDSVSRVFAGREMLLRRSRGYAPTPLRTSAFERQILACGAELKNTFCFTRDNYAFLSHHIGDLENLETLRSFEEGIEHYKRLFHLRPVAVAFDLHPEYLSTKYALALEENLIKVGVQHHHAHVASCMADNLLEGEVIGVAMDGLGFGVDGKLWGGEFFVADSIDAERIAHLDYIPMPGGAQAIREPWRLAAVYLERALGEKFLESSLPFVQSLDGRRLTTLRRMVATETNCPQTSSMGRLFDAVSSLLGLRHAVNYEGQAAIELEAVAESSGNERYEFEVAARGSIIKADSVIQHAVQDVLAGVSAQSVSAKFHLGVAQLIARVAGRIKDERHLDRVVLSGGVFQNMFLLGHAYRILKSQGFRVFTHSRVPPNDAGISFGQAVIADARLRSGRI